ncbi:MAG: 30S ribosomal protein S17e [Candidatus ainarchaeum sp.]|jgi:ribosomal protein S17E|nr:30S ribosomal protein S17e [Candidatus ainarchaeum sp.]MDD3085523.1 30S ribosomal protein S17e [Candidatus ainarchaeum sp.]MDD4128132.1 30S ribosomal protein S17e [Candidatus ainarchaeum sp.]MDD4467546.1 30S ribosomal protein S17e [Candidatus ainarchaeum sp.]HPM85966.1 30S ribosomal protein S17e [archaeon]
MGKSVAKQTKYKGEVLIEEFPDRFGENFEKNKTELNKITDLHLSKTTRNILAGYIVREAKKKKANELK